MYGQKSISQSLLDAVNSAMSEDIHPQARILLKHIKPEHHAVYKPFLAKKVFNGSFKDKTDVLNTAKKAGHLVSENIEEIIEAWADMQKYVKDKAGPQPKGHIGQKAGTRYGGAGQKDDEREKETERLDNKKKEMRKESFGDFKNRLIESLKGNQHKIDKNKNNKIDAHDFEILRAQKEEVEELDELSINTLTRVRGAAVSAASDARRDGDEAKANKRYDLAGKANNKIELKHRALGLKPSGQHTMEEVELDEANKESKKDFDARQARLAASAKETAKDPVRLKRLSSIPGYTAAMNLAKKTTKEEVELDEAGEVKAAKGLTVDTLAGPKKAPKGFDKDNEHTSAKVPLKTEAYTSKELKMAGGIAKDKRYAGGNMTGASNVMDKIKPGLSQTKQAQKALRQANEESEGHEDEKEDKALMKKMIKKSALKTEGKRPESDTVPFVTDASQSPKERLRAALGKVKKEMSNGY